MAYSLHFVPRKKTTEVTVSVATGNALGAPLQQRTWPNWVKLMQEMWPYLGDTERKLAQSHLSQGRTCWLPRVILTDADLERLGF